ncbi:MAG: sigma-54-dependent Fis family transcriptional regulator, partial [Sulfuritalea sp.]|nr:sigma-54-dependent Fis family transcriptional regulator [Sulfuritalea sp.]
MKAPAPLTVLVVDDEPRSLEPYAAPAGGGTSRCSRPIRRGGRAIMAREFTAYRALRPAHARSTSGVEFLRRVRNRWPDTVRLILSGYTDAEDIIAGINQAGIWQYLL